MPLIENITDRSNFMPLQTIANTNEFQALNLSQRRFVVRYIDQGINTGAYDAVDAVKVAYGTGKELKSPQIRAHQILNNRRVRRVLDLHFHRSELDILLSDLQRAVKKSSKMGVLTPAITKALLAFEQYVTAKGNVHE